MRPCSCRYRNDTPRILVAHQTRAVIHERFSGCLIRLREPLRVDVRIEIGIRCRDRDKRCAPRGVIVIEELSPCRKLFEAFACRLLKANMGKLLVIPVDGDIIRPRIIAFQCKCVHEVRAGDGCMDDEGLILLQVDADTNHKGGIFFE